MLFSITVRWLFVTGVALDISGAVMVLGAILRARASEVAEEAVAYVGYSKARLRARVQERRYAISGATLLGVGFMLQLIGYAWMFSSWWMVPYAFVVAVAVGALALLAAKKIGARFYERADELMRKAVE
jgi:hypothetical protein